MSDALIQVQDVSIRLGDFAVRDATLDVSAGEYFVLLGPTGAGKTVLMECIAGLHRPQRGAVSIAGILVNNIPPERRGLGYLPQDYALFPHLSVADNIGFGMRLRRLSAEQVTRRTGELAELLRITHLLQRGTLSLSGGERQRVALARALAIEPLVLLLDEPLSALDEQTREHLSLELRRVHEELGTTTVHVSHNFEETLLVADRIGIVHQGRICQVGAPDDVFRKPTSEFVARFVRSDNILRGRASHDNGRLKVEVAGHTFQAGEGPAGDVFLVVRPEEVSVVKDGPAGGKPNLVSGTLSRIVDRGPMVRLDIDVGTTLIALLSRPVFRRSAFTVGDRVSAFFEPDSAYVFARE
jgi:ABC-type Fe3+/spermidine/putrescine transport system ATPase subunit